MKHSEMPTAVKYFAWLPQKMTSGKTIWLSFYYKETTFTNVEPKHRWARETYYSETEYFLKKMSQ